MKNSVRAITAVSAGLGVILALAGCSNPDTDSRSATSNSAPVAAASAGSSTEHGDHGAAGHQAHEGHEAHGGQGMNHEMGTSGLTSLRKLTGKDFDIAFLSQMIAHHEAAIVMAEQALKTAKDTKTRQDAQQVVSAQTAEIKQMTGWLKQWYAADLSKEQQALVNADMQSIMAMPVTNEAMFYQMMVPHHQGAIDMSELALTKAERPEVKKLAGQIIRDQKAEIAGYQAKLRQEQHK
jgi:uncharacterized protein (DUF305 family)